MDTIENKIVFRTEGDPGKWESTCLPIGNGYMGATFFGGTERETVVLNEKTLWVGGPSVNRPEYNGGNRKGAYKSVKRVQELLSSGNYDEALALLPDLTCETDVGFGAYQCLGDLNIEFPGIEKNKVTEYKRCLDLDRALYTCSFIYDGVTYIREAFASYPARVICMRFRSNAENKVNLRLSFDKLHDGCEINDWSTILDIGGKLADNGLEYHGDLAVDKYGGELSCTDHVITVTNADSVTVFFTALTNYSDRYPTYRSDENIAVKSRNIISRCQAYGTFEDLYKEHYKDYSSLFDRVKLSLNGFTGETADIESLLSRYRENGDTEAQSMLEPLYFQYGRYLLISSSREGSLPANLQGVWNESNTPPWCCDYHINVNLQMNYWGAYNTNLAETAEPLVRYLDSLREPGRITAKEYYNIISDKENPENGWIAHTQSNPFGWTSPGWDFYWGWSTAAVAWLMLNIWEYFEFTRDITFLRERIYPIMRESARFYSQWLIWDDKQQRLVSSPTYSPEHGPVTIGNTYEQSLIMEFYVCFLTASGILGTDKELHDKIEEQIKLLKPYSVSRTGLLKEWFEEDENSFDRSKIQPNHRHISHLLCLYPGCTLTHDTPDLLKASIATLNDRGDESTGWARAYKVNLWARTGDGERAYKLLRGLLTDCTYPNLWDFHPPFQIDGNFGGSAGIAEMLVQSHEGYISVLPAVPAAWAEGGFEGLCARDGFEVSAKWSDGTVREVRIRSLCGNALFIKTNLSEISCDGEIIPCECNDDGIIVISTEIGKIYKLS